MSGSNPAKTAGSPKAGKGRVIWVNRFFHPDESATSIMLTDLVRDLAAQGGAAHHLVTSNAQYAGHDGARADPVQGVVVHRVPAIARNSKSLAVRAVNFLLFYLGALFHLLRCVRRGDVVVALTDPPLIGTICSFVARLKGARCVHWVQDIFPETASRLGYLRENGLFDRMLRHLRNASWHRASTSVTIGENMRAYLVANGVAGQRVTVIQNWAAEQAIRPVDPQSNQLRREWDYTADHCVIGYSGNLGRAHEIETKIAAMQLLHARGEEGLRYLYIGGGARQDDLRRAARSLPDHLIAFRPYQPMDRLADSLSVPDVHWISLQPRLEGLIVPSKLYGALAVGRPIIFIGDAKAEVARILAEAECGASFIPGEEEKLADYLASLAADPDMRRRMGLNGRSYLESHLRRSGRIDQWSALIASLQQSAP
ncbi:glycosyltransferase family 4 protein [Alteraurantiacibacter aestuarii]|uniref:glycosyltransferase family 4 protein n=1 Tax=Alteraurantiacibacter aestuarii TaxID=650004 RepID=UPI0031DEF348